MYQLAFFFNQSATRRSKKMAGTAQQTKAAITLKGSTDIIAEFFRNYLFLSITIKRVLYIISAWGIV